MKVYFQHNWGFFIGSFTDNLHHQHYAVQLSISLNFPISITEKHGNTLQSDHFLIKSNVPHQLSCAGEHLTILFYPTSAIGHAFQHLCDQSIAAFTQDIAEQLSQLAKLYIRQKCNFSALSAEIGILLAQFSCACENQNHFGDARIKAAIQYLECHFERVIPVAEIAEQCSLSPGRFLHLFKEKTGITYRKVQQWNKVSQSFRMLFKQSLTETAHEFGFSDSAHYSKVCKETFGFSPKAILKR